MINSQNIPVKIGQTIYSCLSNEYVKGTVSYIKIYKNHYFVGMVCKRANTSRKGKPTHSEMYSELFGEIWFKNKKHLYEIKGKNIQKVCWQKI